VINILFSPSPARSLARTLLASILFGVSASHAATFTWTSTTGNWNEPARWTPTGGPSGTDNTDVLVFQGDIGTVAGVAPNYTSTNNIATVPFQLGAITLNATNVNNQPSDPPHIIAGNALFFSGATPSITQATAGAITFNTPIRLASNITWAGNGAGAVTFNAGISGFADITKTGNSTFRFGTIFAATPSDNSWIGRLFINAGTVRFNNNADSGRTALRSNPVTLSAGSSLTVSSMLRSGTLMGALGSSVASVVSGSNIENEDIVITALDTGSFAGALQLGPPTGNANDSGKLTIRGPGEQILSGSLSIEKDVFVGGNLTLRGSASLGNQSKGAIVLAGGTFRLDNNTADNLASRLRDGSATSTGLDVAGGGAFIFDGATAGSTETLGRLQMSSVTGAGSPRSRPRSGQVDVVLRHRSAGSGTQLTFQSYERDGSTQFPLLTVQFSATDGAGAFLPLGLPAAAPRVVFNTLPVALADGLFNNPSGNTSTGWAVVKAADGLAFATHGANGVEPVATTTGWVSSPSSNVELTGSQVINNTFSLRSLRIRPSADNTQLDINAGSLVTTGIILTGPRDYSINGPGTIGGLSPRFIHVDEASLLLTASFTGTAPIVKSGEGILHLGGDNSGNLQPLAINRGVVRASIGGFTTLPAGELRFRGGVLEIQGGGTFSRPLVDANGVSSFGTVNWSTLETVSGLPANLQEDRGNGGFAASGGNLTVDLAGSGATAIPWESPGFLQSGYSLVFGSTTATARTTLIDDINLTSTETTINYNAREFRVIDNPNSNADRGVLSGVIGGNLQNDLLKTGTGTLELSGVSTFLGTAIVQSGTLLVSGSIASSNAAQVRSGGTLAGTGTVSQILLEDGGAIAPGDNGVGTLNATSLTWRSGGVLQYNLGAGVADRISLGTGALTKGSASGTFAFNFAGTGQGGRTYVLASFGSTNFTAADFSVVGLNPDISGVFQIVAGELQLTTASIAPPGVTTGDATAITTTTATLNGVVDPKGVATTASFEFGTTIAYGTSIDIVPPPGGGADPVPVSVALQNLAPLTTYHYRLVATNANGPALGLDRTFTTNGPPPEIVVGTVTNITTTGATINGTVDPNGSATTARIDYGLTESYGSSVAIDPAPGAGVDPVNVSAALGNLAPNTTYHYRIVAISSFGTTTGLDNTFATLAVPPTVVTGIASAITPAGATVEGTVNPNGTTATAFFEYGLTTAYGSTAPATAPGNGSTPVGVSAMITGLASNTLYHYRLVAQNPGGTVMGDDATFTTNVLPIVVTGSATAITGDSATVDATINPNGTVTTAFFEYGTTTAYGSTAAVTAPGNGMTPVTVSAILTGLTPETLYHYRIVAQNPGGMVMGDDATFTTIRPLPDARDDIFYVNKGAISGNVLANDLNPATGTNEGLTFDGIVTQPTVGSVSGGPEITYTPPKKFPASGDSFTYRVKDTANNTDIATVTIKPFSAVQGNFAGVIVAGNGDVEDTGSVTVKLTSSGKLTASFIWERQKYALKGSLLASGGVDLFKSKIGTGSALTLSLQLDASGLLDAKVVDAATSKTYTGTLQRAVADPNGLAIPASSAFTATIDPVPAIGITGHGYAVITVGKKRDARVVGRTPDGEAFSDSSALFGSRWVLDPLLYKRKKTNAGQLRSEVVVQTGTTISSDAEWFKIPVPTDPLNAAGIAGESTIGGGKFALKGESGLAIMTAGFGSTAVLMTFSDGNLASPLTANIIMGPKKVTIGGSTLPGLKVKLSTKTGLFTGEFKHPVSGKKTTFAALYRNDVGEARGNFRGPTASGRLVITGP
jgi:autotransporter-associated beta strand protein